ncbi:zf-HC2 domain-containing protein [Actinoplanes sp. NPDC049599]|uniref:zf-HC2 domain-containing protein n=1 Tax=Actinoplanes sp. NPDC049599 TaxID=3363903 RepID=UPI0037B15597
MAEIIDSGAHVHQELLGLHFMDALDPAESDVIHRHLEDCPACRARADEVIDTVAALALLGTDDVDPGTPAPVATPVAAAPARRPGGPVRPSGRAGSTRPSSSRPGEKARRSGRTGKLLQAGSLLALVLVVAGLGLATLLRSPQGEPTPVRTAAAVATDDTTGASASVAVASEGEDGVRIRATVSGLREGTAYVLHAVTSDSTTGEVVRWTGTSAVQEVSGYLPVRIGDLSFFTVSLADGGPVVSVYLPGVPVAPTR